MKESVARLRNLRPLLARASATLILPAIEIAPSFFACGRNCLAYLFIDFTDLATWIVYLLWGTSVAFQYGLWRYKKGPGRDSELGEVGLSIGFYFLIAIIVFFSIALRAIGTD